MPDSRRVVVVLGMHRSGTSAFTAGLAALGVDLGEDLIEAGPVENPKGFFEDRWILDFSDRLLAQLGLRWDSASFPADGWWERPEFDALRLEACEELRDRFGRARRWGFKNPRTARLLPFWQSVFRRLEVEDHYLIAVRNPISVARSLGRRNGFHAAKSHLLWLLYVTEIWSHTLRRRRVFADFDALVADPEASMRRVARQLGIRVTPGRREGLRAYASRFVDRELRHASFEDADLDLDGDAPELVRRAFASLAALSRDEASDRDPALRREWREIRQRVHSLRPLFAHVERLEERVGQLARARDDERRARDDELSRLRATLDRERGDGQRALDEIGAQLGTQLDGLRSQLAEARRAEGGVRERADALAGEGEALRGALAERDRALASLEEELATEREANESSRAELLRTQAALAQAREERRAERTRLESELEGTRRTLGAERSARELLDGELGSLQRELDGARERGGALASELESARAESERSASALVFERRRRAEALARQGRELARALAELRETRTWRATRRLQRALDRLRGLPTGDALSALERDALYFAALCARQPLPEEDLARLAEQLRRGHRDATTSESFALMRVLALLQNLLRLRLPAPGPAEGALGRVGALALDPATRPGVEAPRPPHDAALPSEVVDVVVPVHRGLAETRRCLASVRGASVRTPFELIAVDDSGGDREMGEALEAWRQDLGFTVVRNPGNLGYVASVNRGIELHPDRDVVLLNADAVVHGDWLDRLRRAAYGEWRVGTVTPWSNNAEICSYPMACESAPTPTDAEIRDLDDRVRRIHAGRTATLPTSVGFCTYLRRDCLSDVGSFDEERFGRGYGEENDFSMRARALGWRHVLAADTYVAHTGGVSFGPDREVRIEQALRVVDELHPRYLPEVGEFVARDPLLPLRREIDLDRVGADSGRRAAVLLVFHALGGGTGRHVHELADRWREEDVRVYFLRPEAGEEGVLRLERSGAAGAPNLRFDARRPDEREALERALRGLGIGHLHFHHRLGLPAAVFELPAVLGLAYDFTVHDYFPICPRVHLTDAGRRYCGEPEDVRVCDACVKANGSPIGPDVDVAAWRREFGALLAGARHVFVPSEDLAKRLGRYFPDIAFDQRPHLEPEPPPPPESPPGTGAALRVAVIGAIGEHKGSDVLVDCARDAEERELPLEFHLVGYSDRDDELRELSRVTVHGPYDDAEVHALLARIGCQRALLPSVWPETYCYTLSIAFDARLYPLAFDLGAVAERIRKLGWGELVALDSGAAEINDRLLSTAPPPFPRSRYQRERRRHRERCSDYYGVRF